MLELHLFDCGFDSCFELLVFDFLNHDQFENMIDETASADLSSQSREKISDECVESNRVIVGEFAERVDASGSDDQPGFRVIIQHFALLLLVMNQLSAVLQHGLERSQTPIIVLLRSQQLTSQRVDFHQLARHFVSCNG